MEKSDSIIIIPTYNEKENIENIIRTVFGLEKFFHILIIEDNSPDGTAVIVRKLQAEFPDRLFMVERKGKLGLGTAYIAGFKWAIEHQYDFGAASPWRRRWPNACACPRSSGRPALWPQPSI